MEMAEYALVREEWDQERQALQSMLERYEQNTDKNSTVSF